MPLSKTWNNTGYSIPQSGEINWASLTTFLSDLADNAQATTFQKMAVRTATSSPITVSATADCIVVTNLTVPGAVAVSLPAGATKQLLIIVDGKGDAGTNNITITPAAGNINGSATYVINENHSAAALVYDGTQWTAFADYSGLSAGTIPRSKLAAGTANYVIVNDGTGKLSEVQFLPISQGGTNSNTALNSNRVMISSGGAIVEQSALTASAPMRTNASGLPTTGTTSLTTEVSGTLPVANGGTGVTSSTGTVNVVLSNNPTLVAPALGTPASGVLTNATGLPLTSGVTGTLPVANGGTGVTSSTGTTNVVLSNNPVLVAPALGTPASGVATNLTGLPLTTGVTGVLPTANGGTGQNSTATFPASGTILSDTNTVSGISGKTFTGPSVSDYTDYLETASPPATPSAGHGRIWGKTDKKPYWIDDAGVSSSMLGGSGSGSGEINEVLNPSAATDTTGWTAGTSHTIARDTSNSMLDSVISTTLAMTATTTAAESSTSGDYYTMTSFSTGLRNRKLKIQFYYTTSASQTWDVSIWSGSTRMMLSTDSSGASAIPAGTTGVFTTYFDADSSSSYTLNFTRTAGAGTTTMYVTNVIVGPGIQAQGAVVGPWTSFTPTFTASGGGTVTTTGDKQGFYRRVGDSIQVRISWVFASGTFGTSGYYKPGLPSGLSINTSVVDSTTDFGYGHVYHAANDQNYELTASYDSLNAIQLTLFIPTFTATGTADILKYSTVGPTSPFTFANNDQIYVTYTVPVNEYSGSGTVNLAQNDVEYAFNTGTADANDTTSFGYGPAGTTGIFNTTALTNARKRQVRFQAPIQKGDEIVIQIDNNTGTFTDLGMGNDSNQVLVRQAYNENTNNYGIGWYAVSSTDIQVWFNHYPQNDSATFGGAGSNWNSANFAGYKWRVKKISGGAAVGFGTVVPGTSSGLVSSNGLPGVTTNTSILSSYVGEVIAATITADTITTTASTEIDITGASIALTAGNWMVYYRSTISVTNGAGASRGIAARLRMTDNSNTYVAGTSFYINQNLLASTQNSLPIAGVKFLSISASTTYKLRLTCNQSTATGDARFRGADVADFSGVNTDASFYAIRVS